MALQSVVEKMHRGQRQELTTLCSTVTRAWDKLDLVKLDNVYKRWKLVLDLILKDGGGNKFIKSNRGKIFRAPSREAEDPGKDAAQRDVDDEGLTAGEIEDINLSTEC